MDDERIDLVKLVRQAFALPAVKAAVLDVEAAALCQEIDNWLAASVAEEEQQHG